MSAPAHGGKIDYNDINFIPTGVRFAMQMGPIQHQALTAYPTLFKSLTISTGLNGTFRSEFTGPVWLRRLAGPGLRPLGLGGWWGKVFQEDGSGMNLVLRRGELHQIFPIRHAIADSVQDGKPCLQVRYDPECPFPWPYVTDEIRWWDASTLLGMTFLDFKSISKLALPFLLHVT